MKKRFVSLLVLTLLLVSMALPAAAAETGSGDIAGVLEQTWATARAQLVAIVNNVVFPVIDTILAVWLFIKIGTCYGEYRKHGQFDFTAPAILFACLIFTLTAPLYIWEIV